MNYKVIALMVVCCIAVIAAAGCLSTPQKVLEQASGSSDASYVYTSNAEKDVLAAKNGRDSRTGPCGCPGYRFLRKYRDQDHQDRVYHDRSKGCNGVG